MKLITRLSSFITGGDVSPSLLIRLMWPNHATLIDSLPFFFFFGSGKKPAFSLLHFHKALCWWKDGRDGITTTAVLYTPHYSSMEWTFGSMIDGIGCVACVGVCLCVCVCLDVRRVLCNFELFIIISVQWIYFIIIYYIIKVKRIKKLIKPNRKKKLLVCFV